MSLPDFTTLFEDLYLTHLRTLRVFFRIRGFSPAEAEDLAQETFVRAWKGIQQLEDPEAKEGWLYEIAKNIYKNRLRHGSARKREGRELSIDDTEASAFDLPDPVADPLGQALDGERSVRLRGALEGLSPQMRRSVLLYLEGHSYRDIGALMRVSEETVRAHLFQARRRLRFLLTELAMPVGKRGGTQ
ncbi:MAG TPA: RNA polymerase sigma factor [Thermoanaerobaculia bacterium]|nr:RNA polymerase sigma factor [Thermoanaerobaculia bacterium]